MDQHGWTAPLIAPPFATRGFSSVHRKCGDAPGQRTTGVVDIAIIGPLLRFPPVRVLRFRSGVHFPPSDVFEEGRCVRVCFR